MFCLHYHNFKIALVSIASFIFGCIFTFNILEIDNENSFNGFESALELKTDNTKLFNSLQYFLIIVVISSADNLARRKAIRETWALLAKEDELVKCYFVIGSKGLSSNKILELTKEQIKYNDLFLLSVPDDYSNLSTKVLQALVWFEREFNFNYILKCDDDSFVNVPKITKELKSRLLKIHNLYWGFFDGRAHVKRGGKWEEQEWLLCDRYLPYALGGGYVLSQPLVHFIYENADNLSLYSSEDVSVGAWLSPLNITRHHDIRFDTEYLSRGCSNEYLITHKKSPHDMYFIYKTLETTGKLCEKEVKLRKSYQYNWKVPPTLCCLRNDTIPF
uniref:Hexosyltransferase n=1 Tax=Clastoptera arizonana TaxID=38151 RepID=A0A1B6D0R3_9HEMI